MSFFFQMLHSLAILLVTIFLAFLGCSVERLLAWQMCSKRDWIFIFYFSNFWKRDLWSAWFLLPFCNHACAPSPPLHTQLHLSNASELKGKKNCSPFFFLLLLSEWQLHKCDVNAETSMNDRTKKMVSFSWQFWRTGFFGQSLNACLLIDCIFFFLKLGYGIVYFWA